MSIYDFVNYELERKILTQEGYYKLSFKQKLKKTIFNNLENTLNLLNIYLYRVSQEKVVDEKGYIIIYTSSIYNSNQLLRTSRHLSFYEYETKSLILYRKVPNLGQFYFVILDLTRAKNVHKYKVREKKDNFCEKDQQIDC